VLAQPESPIRVAEVRASKSFGIDISSRYFAVVKVSGGLIETNHALADWLLAAT
jgi:hypothetical protein